MKVNFIKNECVNFDQIKIGEVFETRETIYLKINDLFGFDLLNKRPQYCKGWDTLIPRKSEIAVY